MGKPDYLNQDQLEYLKNKQQLQLLYQPITYNIQNNTLKLDSFDLPIHSISFIEIINNSI
jgi:hypothetical protein